MSLISSAPVGFPWWLPMYLDDIPTDGPGGIEWIEEINPNLHDARDIEIGKELAWSHRWKVRLPGLKRYGDRIMVMKVFRNDLITTNDCKIMGMNTYGPFHIEMYAAAYIMEDKEAREADMIVPVHGWCRFKPAYVDTTSDGRQILISGYAILKDYVEPIEWCSQHWINFDCVPPSKMLRHRDILARLEIDDRNFSPPCFLNGRYVDLTGCIIKSKIDLAYANRLAGVDLRYLTELHVIVLEALGKQWGFGLNFNDVPESECEEAFNELLRLEATTDASTPNRWDAASDIAASLWQRHNPGRIKGAPRWNMPESSRWENDPQYNLKWGMSIVNTAREVEEDLGRLQL